MTEFNHTVITSLYATCNGKTFLLRKVSAALGLGSSSSCEISVICEQTKKPASASGLLVQSQDMSALLSAFRYGDSAKVYQDTSKGKLLLFDGFVYSVSSAVDSSAAYFNFGCVVQLCTADTLYTAASNHMQAKYMTALNGNNNPFTTLSQISDLSERSAEEVRNPAKYAASVIDGTLSDRTTNVVGGYSSSEHAFDKLSAFIDVDNAPTLNVKVMVNGANNAAGKETLKNTRMLAEVSVTDIIKQLERNTGLAVLNSYIAQFGLILAPRIGEGIKPLSAILNIGINKNKTIDVSPSSITGYSDQAPRRLGSAFKAIAVRTTEQGEDISSKYVLWSGGYDKDGKPKLSAGIKLGGYKNAPENSAKILPIGPITAIPLPKWLLNNAISAQGSALSTADYTAYANAMAKTFFGRGLGFPGRLSVSVVYTDLAKFYNHIGEQAKIDLSSVIDGKGMKLDPKYGRLIGIRYQIAGDSSEFSASCELEFDCVCTELEFNTFGISAEDLLCSVAKK